MTSGGWEWRADRGRWIAHAPVERGIVVAALFFVVSQTVLVLTSSEDAAIRRHPWELALWLVLVLPWTIHLLTRLRRQRVTYDGEVVEVVHGHALIRFRPADVAAVRPGPMINRDLIVLRARPIERTFAGVRVPTLRRGTRVRADVPSWWWHQIVGLPAEPPTPWWTQRVLPSRR